VNKLMAWMSLFRKGAEVANPEPWKKGQVAGNTLGFFIVAAVGVAHAYGYPLPIDPVMAMSIGGAVATLFNSVFTVITSARIGIEGPEPEPAVPTYGAPQVASEGPAPSAEPEVDPARYGQG